MLAQWVGSNENTSTRDQTARRRENNGTDREALSRGEEKESRAEKRALIENNEGSLSFVKSAG